MFKGGVMDLNSISLTTTKKNIILLLLIRTTILVLDFVLLDSIGDTKEN